MSSKPTLLIADANTAYCALFSQYFRTHGFEVFPSLASGTEVVQYVEEHHVDVLLLDLVLPRIDGCAVIERIGEKTGVHQPMVFIHTALSNDQMISYALKHGVKYFFAKMTDCEIVYQRIMDILAMEQGMEKPALRVGIASFSDESIREVVTQLIRSVGVPAHIKGYHHLRAAIEYLINHRDHAGNIKYYGMTTHVYPQIASNFSTSPQRVERNIRNAIEIAWNRGNIDTLHEIFGYTVNDKKGRPTNSEFIAMMADRAILMLSAQ